MRDRQKERRNDLSDWPRWRAELDKDADREPIRCQAKWAYIVEQRLGLWLNSQRTKGLLSLG